MYQMLLLGTELIDGDRWNLFVLELSKRKILRVVKFDKEKLLWKTWKKGMITEVDTIAPWNLEDGTFITSKDHFDFAQPPYIDRVLLNTASCPDNIFCKTLNRYGLVRISDIEVSPQNQSLRARIWAWKNEYIEFDVKDRKWNSFWEDISDNKLLENYSKLFSSQKRKFFAVVESGLDKPVIVDFLVY